MWRPSSIIISCVILYFAQLSIAENNVDSLGFGIYPYDGVFKPENLRSRVLALGGFDKAQDGTEKRQGVSIVPVQLRKEEVRVAKGFSAFARRMSASLRVSGGFGLFRASLASNFDFATTRQRSTFFSRTSVVIQKVHARINVRTPPALRSLLRPEVQSFLTSASPLEIFQVIGSHVTTGVVVGGRLDLWASSSSSAFRTEAAFRVAAKANFGLFVKGRVSLSGAQSSTQINFNSFNGLLVKGGKYVSGENATDEWACTLTTGARTVDYLPDGVIEIWRLIQDPGKSREVRLAYEKLFGRQTITLRKFTADDPSSRVNDAESTVFVPSGWKPIFGGADLLTSGSTLRVYETAPVFEGNETTKIIGWRVKSEGTRSGEIQTFAIAIFDPFDKIEVKVTTSRNPTGGFAEVNVSDGFTLVGGGAIIEQHGAQDIQINAPNEIATAWNARASPGNRGPIKIFAIGIRSKSGEPLNTRLIKKKSSTGSSGSVVLKPIEGTAIVAAGPVTSKSISLMETTLEEDGEQITIKSPSSRDFFEGRAILLEGASYGDRTWVFDGLTVTNSTV